MNRALMEPARVRPGRTRRLLGIALVMLGLPTILWFGAAILIADQIRYPGFLSSPNGDDLVGANVPERTGHPYDLARAALGVMPDEFKPGAIETGGALGGFPIEVTGLIFHGSRRATIVLIPPAGAGAEQLIPYVKFLYDAGYSVVALDSLSNAHLGTDFGYSERMVALKAAAKLQHDGVHEIALFGISEGGAAAIFAAGEQPSARAVIADSSYANLDEMLRSSPSIGGLNPAFASTVMWIAAHRWFGRPLDEISPADAARSLRCPLLVIQNVGDPITPVTNGQAIEFAARKAGDRTQLWIAPAHGHGNALFEVPDQYRNQVLDFLASTLEQ